VRRALAVILVIGAGGVARADDLAVYGPAASLAEAYEHALEQTYPDQPVEPDKCEVRCQTTVERGSLGSAGVVRIVSSGVGKSFQGHVHAIVFGSGHTWWSTAPDQIESSDCGAGHCIERTIRRIDTLHRAGKLEVRFRIEDEHRVNERGGERSTVFYTRVVTCTLGDRPTCSYDP
jgi:hypothetical protein